MNISRRGINSRPGWLVLGLWAIVLLGLLAVQGCTPSAQDIRSGQKTGQSELSPAPKVGRLAPDFTLTDLEGNSVTLSDFRGKVVFINFFATWCPPCRAEMPEIESLHQDYKDKGVVVIGVDIAEPESVARQYVQQGGFSWTFVLDSTGEVARDAKGYMGYVACCDANDYCIISIVSANTPTATCRCRCKELFGCSTRHIYLSRVRASTSTFEELIDCPAIKPSISHFVLYSIDRCVQIRDILSGDV